MVKYDSFDTSKDVPDLSGKVILLTGGTGGVGREAVLQLAAHNPSHILFTGRNQSSADSLIAAVSSTTSKAKVTFLPMDLASLADVKATAEKVLTLLSRLDVLIANAGILASPGLTKDGYEVQFGTNHLGNAALALHLLPLMLATAKSAVDAGQIPDVRFIALTSLGYRGHPAGGIQFDGLRTTQSDMLLGEWGRYGQSKLANILFARELARRYGGEGGSGGITSCAVHPGVVETAFVTDMGFWNKALVRVSQLNRLLTPEQGSLNTVWAATSPDVKAKLAAATEGKATWRKSGGRVAFFEPVGRANAGQDICFDEALMKKLWEWTEEQVGVKAPTTS